jgi:hypothetical protein
MVSLGHQPQAEDAAKDKGLDAKCAKEEREVSQRSAVACEYFFLCFFLLLTLYSFFTAFRYSATCPLCSASVVENFVAPLASATKYR